MPSLTLIVGCNGAGKSTFANSFLPDGLTSFDYDRYYLEIFNSMPDSECRDDIAKNQTTNAFEASIENAISQQIDFCYETNFDSNPLFWPNKFKENGYSINLIFFCLDNQELARHRVQVRTEFKGHFVNNQTIDLKWKAGYKNINMFYKFFDKILIVDNSKQNEVYTNLLQIEFGRIVFKNKIIPDYFKHRLPDIYKLIQD